MYVVAYKLRNILTRASKNDFADGRKTNIRLHGTREINVEPPLKKKE